MHQCSPLGGGVVCKMYQVSYLYFNYIMTYRLLEKLGEGKYEDLFIAALRYHGMLCIGLYRYLDLESNPNSRTSRYPSVVKKRRIPQDCIQDPGCLHMGSMV